MFDVRSVVRSRRTEERNNRVAHELLDRPAMPLISARSCCQ
jgi:hypothetical protein